MLNTVIATLAGLVTYCTCGILDFPLFVAVCDSLTIAILFTATLTIFNLKA